MDQLLAAYLGPLATLCGAAVLLRAGRAARSAPLAELSALIALAAAAGLVALLAVHGPGSAALPFAPMIGARIDIVSAAMLSLVAFVGWIVTRFSVTYLQGEPRRGPFLAWLLATLACVQLLVTAGTLVQLVAAWVLTSLSLHRLLLFYPDRPAARRAARKKFIPARASDLALAGAAALLYLTAATGDIDAILAAARAGGHEAGFAAAAALLALAAVLKSAQFPLHGWLTEVMEAPTPVSALLHAGVVNAGGFLLVRFSDVLLHAPGVLAALAAVGGFTALFAGLVMLTQPAVKTSLAWSTVAQMGFMVLQCGLALFPLALLHMVAHSLYKAHAFLASGGAIEQVTAWRRPGPVAVPGGREVALSFGTAIFIYVLVGLPFGIAHKPPQAVALGAILVLGVAYLIAQGLASQAPRALARRTALAALAATVSYFALQAVAVSLTAGTLPPPPRVGALEWVIIVVALGSFGLTALIQTLFPLWSGHPAAAGLRVHLANGLYANAVFDRLIGNWAVRRAGRETVK